jgi:hypothetical protein
MKAKSRLRSRRSSSNEREFESLLRRAARALGLLASPRLHKAGPKKSASAA